MTPRELAMHMVEQNSTIMESTAPEWVLQNLIEQCIEETMVDAIRKTLMEALEDD